MDHPTATRKLTFVWPYVMLAVVVLATSYFAATPFFSQPDPESPAAVAFFHTQLWRSRLLLIVLTATAAMLGIVHASKLSRILREFFSAKTGPLNLSLARILVFSLLLGLVHKDTLMWFSELPVVLRQAPIGLEWANRAWFFNPDLILGAHAVFVVCCMLAILGAFTRLALPAALILSVYLLAIPHFDGKVDHGAHHVVWFAGILAASPCAVTLSLDGLLLAWRHLRDGTNPRVEPSTAYALPLRFIWLLMGIVYWFPGFWKLWSCGLAWALTDNLAYHMYAKWAELENFTPIFPIDQYPLMFRSAALATIAFELSFIFLVFSPAGRAAAAACGWLFHNGAGAFLRIRFITMQWCYLMLFNWEKLFSALGARVLPGGMTMTFTNTSRLSCLVAAMVYNLDVFQCVRFRNQLESAKSTGMPALRARRTLVLTSTVGSLLLVINSVFGVLEWKDAWPFAAFPTFAYLQPPRLQRIELVGLTADGEKKPLDYSALRHMGRAGVLRLQRRILRERSPEHRESLIHALKNVVASALPGDANVVALEIYQILDRFPYGRPRESQQHFVGRILLNDD